MQGGNSAERELWIFLSCPLTQLARRAITLVTTYSIIRIGIGIDKDSLRFKEQTRIFTQINLRRALLSAENLLGASIDDRTITEPTTSKKIYYMLLK